MKLYLPKNIFTSVFVDVLPKNSSLEILHKESALLCKQLETDTSAIALIPTLELINHRSLFLSGKYAVSFDGGLSNSFISFSKNERIIEKIKVRGDISLNEIILAKIIFSEKYSSEIEMILDPSKDKSPGDDYLIVGDENFLSESYKHSMSFSDQIAEVLDLPYVNFVFASQDKESIEKFNSIPTNIDTQIEDNIPSILSKLNLPEDVKNFVIENINSVYYEMTPNEIDAANELIKLVYYHGLIEDIFDLKFV